MRTGNGAAAIADLDRLIRVVERLAYVPRKVAVIAAPKLTALVQREFRTGTDPYGRPWRPLKASTLAKGRRPPPLSDTRRLRDGTGAVVTRSGIRLTVGAAYGVFHQYGFRVGRVKVGPRKVLPGHGMPASWKAVLDESSRMAARRAVSG